MSKKSIKDSRTFDPGLSDRLRVLIYTRLVFISILLAATIFIVLSDVDALYGISVFFIFALIVATILASFVFVIVLFFIDKENFRKLRILSYAQIFWDIIFATAVVYMTGGVDSIFYILYYLDIVLASVLLFRRGGLLAASVSAIFYGGILALEVRGVLPQFGEIGGGADTINETHVLAKIIINWLFFFFLAFVASFVAEKLREAEALLEEKQIDIKNLENFNSSVVESLKSGLLTVSMDGTILSANTSARGILGLDSGEIVGKNLKDMFPDISLLILDDKNEFRTNEKSFFKWETTFEKQDERIFIGLNVFPFTIPDIFKMGRIVIFDDLTSFKEMESRVKRSEKLAAIGELAAGIAHEIRNPLTSMSGAIELLKQEESDTGPKNRLMEIVLRETSRLNYLISDFLNFAKTPKLSKEVFNINSLIEETTELFMKNRSESNGSFIEKNFCENVYLSADPQQIKQVMWNLLKNSTEAMVDGGKISIRTAIMEDMNEFLISFNDEGEGIMPEDLGKIFSPFFTTKKGGTGLGLATVHKIIEEHGGRINVDSKLGIGTEFRVYLPLN